MTPRATLRLLDANANRAMEGLRVCEDIVRFHVGAPRLFQRVRRMRHAVMNAVRRLPVNPSSLWRARDSRADIGRRAVSAPLGSLEQLLVINFQRAKESLRVLEECSRVIAAAHSRAFQRLRFELYVLERDTLLAVIRHH